MQSRKASLPGPAAEGPTPGKTRSGTVPAARPATARPTLRTIAELCGLGVPTVSRALNGSPEVSEATRRRIRRIADEIGYIPDRAAQRLRTGRTNVINLAFVMNRDDQLGRLIPSIATSLLSTGFQIGIAPALSHEDGLATIRQMVENRMADAVVFNETLVEDPRAAYLLDCGFPFASHGRNSLSHMHPHYDYDNAAFARMTAEYLHGRGRRWLALLGPPEQRHYGFETRRGAEDAAAALGLHFRPFDGLHSHDLLTALQAAATRFVDRHPSCDGYVASTGAAALAIASALHRAGRVIGRDVDLVAKGARSFLEMVDPAIVAVEEEVGRAADFLTCAVLQAIRAPALPPMQAVEQPDFTGFRPEKAALPPP